MLVPLLAALTAGLAVTFVVLTFGEQRSRSEAMLASLGRVRMLPQERTLDTATATHLLRDERFSSVNFLNTALSRRAWSRRMAGELAQAGVRMSVGTFTLVRMVLITGSVVAVVTMTGTPLLGLPAGILAVLLPSWFLRRARRKRIQRLEQQLPEVLTLLSNAVKSGFGLMQALQYIGDQVEEPLGGELRRVLRDVAVGTPVEAALAEFSERFPSESLGIVTTAIIVQRSAGGNLAEILDTVASTIRDRDRIQGEIKTLTTQQMYTGYLLALLPAGIAGMIFVMSPGYMEPLFSTGLGKSLLAGAVTMDLLVFMVIRRILAIEV